MIRQAAALADYWHNGQVRKYTKDPYIFHPGRVAMMATLIGGSKEMIAAAWLHDVLEDTRCPLWRLYAISGDVASMVVDLTNPSKKHPSLSRVERKKMDRDHLASADPEVKILKMLDRTDNLRDMHGSDLDFKKVYVAESYLLLEVLKDADKMVASALNTAIMNLEDDFMFKEIA